MKRPKFDLAMVVSDMYIVQLVAVKILVVLVLAMVKPAEEQNKSIAHAEAIGQLVVEARWPDGNKSDVDLWVRAPLDKIGVGYSRRDDVQSAYLRDDTGSDRDGAETNVEFAFCRTLAPGLYAVNVHMYSMQSLPPVAVEVVARINRPVGPPLTVARRTVMLKANGDDVTAFVFDVDDTGRVQNLRYDAHVRIRGG